MNTDTYQHNHSTLESMSQAVWYNRWTLEKFSRYLHGDILEVGCGIGNFTKSLVPYGNIWACDIDMHCLQETKKNVPSSIRVGKGDIEKGQYFFGKKSFDCIICMNVLEHIENDKQAIENMYKLLKPKGYLILLVPIHPSLYGTIDKAIHHYRRYNVTSLLGQLQEQKYTIIQKRKLNFLGAIGWFFSGKILKKHTVASDQLQIFNAIAPIILPVEEYIEPPIGTSILLVAQK